MQSHSARLSTAGGLGAILLWSTTFALARSLSEKIGPLTAGAAAYLIGGAFCLIRVFSSRRGLAPFAPLPRKYLWGCGFLFALYTAAIYLAVGLAGDREQLLEVALVNYLWPATTILLSLLLLGKQARVWLWPGTVLALAGILLVMTQGTQFSWRAFSQHLWSHPAPYGLAFTGAVAWGLYSNLARRWSGPGGQGGVAVFMPVTGLVMLVLQLVANSPRVHWTHRAIGEAIALGAVTALSYMLWDVAMRKGNLLFVAACSYLTPLLSTVVSCVYLQVSPSPKLWLGCALLISGSFITWLAVSDTAV